MHHYVRAPYWVSQPGTRTAKLGGASYDNAEDAIAAALASPLRPLVVYGSLPIICVVAPVVVREIV
jgi:hypothetical protein